MIKFLMSSYIVLLGVGVGIIGALGIIVAPVIFHPENVLGDGVLNHFQSGLLMSTIFVRFNLFLNALILIVMGTEFFIQISRKIGCLVDKLAVMGVLSSALFFSFYLTPKVLGFQTQGMSVVNTPEFQTIHYLSEVDFKMLMASLIMLAFVRLSRFFDVLGATSTGCQR